MNNYLVKEWRYGPTRELHSVLKALLISQSDRRQRRTAQLVTQSNATHIYE